MQGFQSIPELARHFLGAAAAPAARGGVGSEELQRLRGYAGLPPPTPAVASAQQLPVKCPRCDSTNTKFCYYNNYNLAQPRHFCKSCRRYWTKGGVLRNVPVGGGCRKSKRASSSSSTASKASSKNSPSSFSSDKGGHAQLPRHPYPASRPSSKASSGVAAAFAEPIILAPQNQSSIFDALAAVAEAPLCFQDAPAPLGLPSLTTSTTVASTSAPSQEFSGFAFQQTLAAEEIRVQLQQQQTQPPAQILNGFALPPPPQQLVSVEPPAMDSAAGGLESLDWPGAVVDPTYFDLSAAAAADPGMYWSQSQWADTDHSLYLP